jgi:hypothetical protein
VKEMKPSHATLCFPDREKSCFGCCPPIRPAGYEHIQHKNIIQRILRENTRAMRAKEEFIQPITGFSCWALGYLDKDCRLIGCLLHPEQNNGRDLRCRVDYGQKCRREICPQAKTFDALESDVQEFWLQMTTGLDAFSYSSTSKNPLFKMMGWGRELLTSIARSEPERTFTWPSFLKAYPLFSTDLSPRGNAYLLQALMGKGNHRILRNSGFRAAFEGFARSLPARLMPLIPSPGEGPFVHRLDMDPSFLDFLRLSVSIRRLEKIRACRLKDLVDDSLARFGP